MSDDRLTPELAALLRQAQDFRGGLPAPLRHALAAYEASLRPQPVECLMTRWPEGNGPDGWEAAYETLDQTFSDEVWRVTITPIERVR